MGPLGKLAPEKSLDRKLRLSNKLGMYLSPGHLNWSQPHTTYLKPCEQPPYTENGPDKIIVIYTSTFS